MIERETRGTDALPTGLDSYAELIDELPWSVLELDSMGGVVRTNLNGQLILDGPAGDIVRQSLARLVDWVGASGKLGEANLSLGAMGEARVWVSRQPNADGFLAVVDRDAASRWRTEASVLREMLSVTTSATSVEAAAGRILEQLSVSLGGSQLALFLSDPLAETEPARATCVAWAGSDRGLDGTDSVIQYVLATGRTLHFPNAAKAPLPVPCPPDSADSVCVLVLPVRSHGERMGALYVSGASNGLGVAELRLLQGLVDGLGALVRHSMMAEALSAERQALHSLMDNLPDAVLEQGSSGAIVHAGGRVQPIVGRDRDQLLGLTLEELIVPEERDSFRALLERAGAVPLRGEFRVLGQGQAKRCEVSVRTGGSPRRVWAVFRDLAPMHKLEEEAAKAKAFAAQRDRLATIGLLTAGVAHELNNPLAFLRSNLSSLKSYVEELSAHAVATAPEAMVQELTSIVDESIHGLERITQLVRAVKGAARHKAQERIRFSVEQAVADALLIFRGARKSQCVVHSRVEGLPEAWGSPSALEQVLLNLLQNGLDAMGGQGALSVEGTSLPDGWVQLAVRDHGPGIPKEIQAQIFEPFFTTKEVGKGTGLGLHLCQQIVQEHSGVLTFETGPAGTTFYIRLPSAGE